MSESDLDPMWDTGQAIKFCRALEEKTEAMGLHVAFGGSVLHKGYSEKDLDVFVYPHFKENEHFSFNGFICSIMDAYEAKICPFYKDTKVVYVGHEGTKRIDFFLLS